MLSGDAQNSPDPTNTATSGEAANAAADQAAGVEPPATPETPPVAGEHMLGGSNEPGESKASEGEASAEPEGEAEDLELQIPEGFTVDEETLGSFKALAKEAGISQETAQKLVNFQAEVAKKELAAAEKQWADIQEAWKDEIRKDPDFGGAKLAENLAHANRVLTKFGGPKLIEDLQKSGFSNHPELVRFCIRLGLADAEDSIAGAANAPDRELTWEEKFAKIYDNKGAATKLAR